MASTKGGFPPFLNELRRLGGELIMAARYPDLGQYRAELEQMGQRLLQIVDELMTASQINPQIGLPPQEPQAVPAVPGEVPVGPSGPNATPEAAAAEILKAIGGIPVP